MGYGASHLTWFILASWCCSWYTCSSILESATLFAHSYDGSSPPRGWTMVRHGLLDEHPNAYTLLYYVDGTLAWQFVGSSRMLFLYTPFHMVLMLSMVTFGVIWYGLSLMVWIPLHGWRLLALDLIHEDMEHHLEWIAPPHWHICWGNFICYGVFWWGCSLPHGVSWGL